MAQLFLLFASLDAVSSLAVSSQTTPAPPGLITRWQIIVIVADTVCNGKCIVYQVKKSEFQTQLGYCVVFLGKSASLHSGVEMGTDELSGKHDETLLGGGEGGFGLGLGFGEGGSLEMDWHPIQGGSSTPPSILVASCY